MPTSPAAQDERYQVALDRAQAISLARALRDLRESTWPEREVTQAQLAKALSSEGRVPGVTLSSWESLSKPKTPSVERISAYARFFCTERSLEGEPHLIPEDQLTPEELDRFQELKSRLLRRFHAEEPTLKHIFRFDAGPVIVICPDAPEEVRGTLAKENDPNFTRLQKYGDLDALVELYGHLRAENPSLDVFHKLASEFVDEDYRGHVILLGGIGWNKITRMGRFFGKVPVKQIDVTDLPGGDVFEVGTADGIKSFYYPESEGLGEQKELVADVAYIARLRNPFQFDRTLTICNGIHSRGVLGAVRCFTDPTVREHNEKYLADQFPDGEFAILLRVQVVGNETMAPDLRDFAARLYEWEPMRGGTVTEAGIAAARSVAAVRHPLTPVAG
jgi:hypothetical protein